jgi:gliding motility-associated-like protein
VGSYTFDKDEGCVPLEVNFEAEVEGAHLMEWDMGDGIVVKDQLKYTHTYTDTGRFIPLMVLKDTFGCQYIMPPIDSIYVYPYPDPNFSYTIACAGDPIDFTNLTKSTAKIESCEWDFGDGQKSPECDPSHIFEESGWYDVKLTSTNEFGCAQTVIKRVKVYGMEADFTHTGDAICLDDTIYVVDKSVSDTNIVSYQWYWEVGNTSVEQNPKMKFESIGPKWVTLIVRDELGCTDTLRTDKILVIGDTVNPDPTYIHRVSVVDDFSHLVEVKSSPIVDFKGYQLYRQMPDGSFALVDESFSREDTVLHANGLDTRNQTYCYKVSVVNTCNRISDLSDVDIHCSVNCGVQADTNQNIVSWSDYIGWDQVDEFVINREHETQRGVYFALDSIPGTSFTYFDTTVSCHTEHHYRITAKYQNQKIWLSNSDTCGGQPFWVNKVPAPKIVRVTVVDNEYTQLDWKPLLNAQTPIAYYLVEKSNEGVLFKPFGDAYAQGEYSLDDKAVDVNSGSYWYRMRAVDECNDTGGYSNLAKSVYLQVDTNADDRPILDWSHYIHWEEGVSHYEIQRKEEDGSFTSMGSTFTGQDTQYVDEISDWLLRPSYCYRVIAFSEEKSYPKVVSISNEDCAPIRSRIYVPNAFSPNDDQLNDGFRPVILYIRNYHMTIYNRWGEKVFESTNPYDHWDGNYEGEESQPGVFIYVIEALGADLVKYNLSGSFHLVK